MRELQQEGKTILLVEQNARQALQVADQGYVMERGRIVISGSGRDLLAMPEVRRRPTFGPVAIGGTLVGDGEPVYMIGEIGINHNGDLDLARKLIDVAADAGCQAVKFQKRTPSICVPIEQRSQIRQTPWGEMTYLEYKERTEFGRDEYRQISKYCDERGLHWFASPWDVPSVDFLEEMDVPVHKIASASIAVSTPSCVASSSASATPSMRMDI